MTDRQTDGIVGAKAYSAPRCKKCGRAVKFLHGVCVFAHSYLLVRYDLSIAPLTSENSFPKSGAQKPEPLLGVILEGPSRVVPLDSTGMISY